MDADRARAQLDRILASATFSDAERASRFLRFVVESALDGHSSSIKESVIGVEVLGRSPSFDPKTDPIVRVEAGRLRARLGAYYQNEGKHDAILIDLPKGGYVPEFSERPWSGRLRIARHPAVLLAIGTVLGLALAAALAWFRSSPSPDRGGVLRLSILPPGNAPFESFAISPDGRKLAFTAVSNGKLTLWVQSLDSLEARPLTTTEDALNPFWSRDSRSIGFFAVPNKLRTIQIAGGPAQDTADAVIGRGGAWNPDGTILFCPRPVGVLYQVAATGGTPKPATTLDASRGEVTHGFPQFLPDGRHFIYLAASSRAGQSSIRVGSLDSTTSKVLVSSDTSAAYSPGVRGQADSLLFVHDGALIAQPFDVQRLELTGERVVVVPQIRSLRWHQAAFSVSGNGVLLYEGGSAENQQLAWFDRQGRLLTAVGPRNSYNGFILSPDERHVAISRGDDPDTALPTVWIMDLGREGAISRFTDTGVEQAESLGAWSADSSEIVFSRGDDQGMRLLRHPLDHGAATVVLDSKGPKFSTDWSSDGRFIAFNSQWPDYQHQHGWIASLTAAGQPAEPRPFLQHSYSEGSVSFSPVAGRDGPRWIAYASDETGRLEVYVRDFLDGSHKWQVSNRGGTAPHWRRDGRELFYLTQDGTLMAVAVKQGETFDFGMPQALFETGVRLTPQSLWANEYAVAADGQRFLLNRRLPGTAPGAITAVVPWQ
jgi:Tol biopolymer transport system component